MADSQARICFVAPNAFPLLSGDEDTPVIGGAELQQVIVARELVNCGFQVSMICLDFGQQDQIEIDGITVFRAFEPNAGIPVLRFIWPRLVSIWSCLKLADADIYYYRTAGMLAGVLAAFCRRNAKKSIFAAAGNPDLELNTPRIRYARDRWIYEYGLRHVDRILVQNRQQQQLCRKNFGREATLIPNCYPVIPGSSTMVRRSIIWVSTIRSLKRPELFLDVAEMLPEYQFKMIGGPSSQEASLYHSIRSRAENIANVDFVGFVPYSRIDGYFDGASVLVNTSESEGFPNTFLQAWARGVPTVSFVDSGARWDGHRIGCQVRSVDHLSNRLVNWMSDEDEREKEGQRCRSYVERTHSPAAVISLYSRTFNELLQQDT